MIKRKTKIDSTTAWKLEDVADSLIRSIGHKSFASGLGSEPVEVWVVISVYKVRNEKK